MATQPPANLPLFYKNLVPLQNGTHAKYRARPSDKAPFLATAHAVPVTIDEFVFVQRHFPIIFSVGDNPVPLALFGLNEGVNIFVKEDGSLKQDMYVPAYVRRYPWMLAKMSEDANELSLCFDPDSDLVGENIEGEPLFDGDKVSEATNNALKFCEEFELSAQRTGAFITELKALEILMDGEVAIQITDNDQPFVYRGFQMVNEEKFRALTAEQLKTMHDNGMLPLIVAHLFSLSQIREIFMKQHAEGKVPSAAPVNPAIAPA